MLVFCYLEESQRGRGYCDGPARAARHTLWLPSKYSQEFSCSQLAQQAEPAAAAAWEGSCQVNKPKVRVGIFPKTNMI